MTYFFDHEKLRVYQDSVAFVAWATDLLADISPKVAACDQLDRSSTSMPLNIAEGNGKFRAPDRCRFFDIARGSALESAAALDVLAAKRRITDVQVIEGKRQLQGIVSMLVGLIKSNSETRVYDESEPYLTKGESSK